MVKYSRAYRDFREQIAVSRELLRAESRLRQPPTPAQVRQSNGLKGGVAVLTVAAFEGFLHSAFSERLEPIVLRIEEIDGCDLPNPVWVHHVFESLNRAMKGHNLAPPPQNKIDRLPAISRASRHVLNGILDPTIFCDTMGNPNPANVKSVFKNVGINDVLTKIKPQFDARWKAPTASTFIEDKLQEIINRRNRVAHSADTLGIARADLAESVRFLSDLAAVIDQELGTHIKHMIKTAPRRTRPII